MTQSKTGRKALALFLAMMMLFSLLPASAMAEDPVTEAEIIEEWNDDSFVEEEIFEEEYIEEEPVYEELIVDEQVVEETEIVDEEAAPEPEAAGLSLSDNETFDAPPDNTSSGDLHTDTGTTPVDKGTTITDTWTDGQTIVIPEEGLTIGTRVTVTGSVTLILNGTLDVPKGISVQTHMTEGSSIASVDSLTIQGPGTLIAGGADMEDGDSGIGGSVTNPRTGNITIESGTVIAIGNGNGAGIGGGGNGGTITVKGGTVTAKGGNYGIENDAAITIKGGTVYAEGTTHGILSNGALKVSDSTVTAKGTNTPDSYGINAATVTIERSEITAEGGTYAFNAADNTVTIGEGLVVRAGENAPGSKINTADFATDHQQKFVHIYEALVTVPYLDRNRNSQSCDDYVLVVSGAEWRAEGSDWFVLKENQTVDDRITVTGDVNLILCDGAKLIASEGINVSGSNSLTIYGQSDGSGELVATGAGEYAGIGGHYDVNSGTIKIYGGKITAKGGTYAAGIGGGGKSDGGSSGTTFEIYNATVTATGGDYGAGIGGGLQGSLGAITIGSGKITAKGGTYAAGIGAGDGDLTSAVGGTVTINGGEVFATGGGDRTSSGKTIYAAGIGGNAYGTNGGTVTLGPGMIAFAGDSEPGVYVADYAGAANHSQPYAHVYAGVAPAPTFDETHSLTLGGEIGVIFFVKPNGVDISGGTMTFRVKGKEDTIVNASYATKLSDGRYKFAAYVPSIMMAEPITATFTCGDTTITDEYSVLAYTDKFDTLDADDLTKFGEADQNIVKRMADYGHYIQLFLKDVRGWDFNKYAQMTKSYNSYTAEGDTNSIQDVLSKVASYAIQRGTNTNLQSVGYTLVMDSKTSIKVYLTPIDGFSGTVTATLDNGTENVAVQEGNRYVVTISDIAAHELGNTHSIKVNAGGVESITTVSALSYVDTIMNHNTYKTDVNANNAMAALYYYSAAVPSA